jgi:regulatory protein
VKEKSAPSLRARALQALARREHSRAELKSKLLYRAVETDNLDALLDDLEQRGWLSDVRALEQTVRIRSTRFGTQRIAHELRLKGISEELINASIPQLKDGELEAARNVWQRKFAAPPQDQKEKAKQVRFLQSRGFSMDVIFKVMKISDTDD